MGEIPLKCNDNKLILFIECYIDLVKDIIFCYDSFTLRAVEHDVVNNCLKKEGGRVQPIELQSKQELLVFIFFLSESIIIVIWQRHHFLIIVDKKRRPSQIEMMKANLKKVEKAGSDSEDEKVGMVKNLMRLYYCYVMTLLISLLNYILHIT